MGRRRSNFQSRKVFRRGIKCRIWCTSPLVGGFRISLGMNFPMIQVKLVFAKILQNYSFELSPYHAHGPTMTALIWCPYHRSKPIMIYIPVSCFLHIISKAITLFLVTLRWINYSLFPVREKKIQKSHLFGHCISLLVSSTLKTLYSNFAMYLTFIFKTFSLKMLLWFGRSNIIFYTYTS